MLILGPTLATEEVIPSESYSSLWLQKDPFVLHLSKYN